MDSETDGGVLVEHVDQYLEFREAKLLSGLIRLK